MNFMPDLETIGRIAESGKVKDLIENKGIFEKMWNDYQTAVEWRVV